MSQEAPSGSSRKEKRAKRDAERAAKFKSSGKKRKFEEVVAEGDMDDGEPQSEPDQGLVSLPLVEEEKEAPQPPSRKRKKIQTQQPNGEKATPANIHASQVVPAPAKKQRVMSTEEPSESKSKQSRQRFIVFCGNLPFSTTDASLELHFAKLKPFTLRHRTDPRTKKSKGFAFIEFENYDRMKTCLKIYHHSYFDPDNPTDGEEMALKKGAKGRKINVELTAGGGGGTEARKEKIKVKNDRLDEQRKRRAEAERVDKARKEKKSHAAKLKDGGAKATQKQAPAAAAEEETNAMSGMHPSRMARMQ